MRRRRRELAQSSVSNGDGSVTDGAGEVPPTPGMEEMAAAVAAAGEEGS